MRKNHAADVAASVSTGRRAVKGYRRAASHLLAAGDNGAAYKAHRHARRAAGQVKDYQGQARRAAKHGDV